MNKKIIELTESMVERESFPTSLENQSIQNGEDDHEWEWWASVVLGVLITATVTFLVGALSGCTATISIRPIETESVDAEQQAMTDDAMQWDRVEEEIKDNHGRK